MNDGAARENAIQFLGLDKLAKVSNTEYALITPNAEGIETVVVVKVTVPKAQLPIDEMVDNYAAAQAEVAERMAERAAERAAKKAEKEAAKPAKAPRKSKKEVDLIDGDVTVEVADTDEIEF